jgi:hypothetical protein
MKAEERRKHSVAMAERKAAGASYRSASSCLERGGRPAQVILCGRA